MLPMQEVNKPVNLEVIEGGKYKFDFGLKEVKVRRNKDGSVDKRHSNKIAGKSSEVYPFTTKEEIKSMIDVFDNHIDEACDENKKQIAYRNKLLFLVGINISLRASDLITLKWNFFFDDNGKFKDYYILQPKKQRKQNKFVKLFFNKALKKAILSYIEEYPIQDMNDYLFKSRKGDGAISERTLWRIIVEASDEAGIRKNVGSHTLRKTFGFWAWHNAEDKSKALVTLQMLFNHSSTQTTIKYIGLLNSEVEDMFNNVDLGLEYM